LYIASRRALQYFPDVVVQEQTGCAHFSLFAAAISLFPGFGSVAHDLKEHLKLLHKTVSVQKGTNFAIRRR
jgi:hypothetical protein